MSKVKIGNRKIHLPKSRPLRLLLGVLLVLLGMLGFLPVIGFWMIPLGIIVLSIDIPRFAGPVGDLSHGGSDVDDGKP